jgi:hypothetical protein
MLHPLPPHSTLDLFLLRLQRSRELHHALGLPIPNWRFPDTLMMEKRIKKETV